MLVSKETGIEIFRAYPMGDTKSLRWSEKVAVKPKVIEVKLRAMVQ